MTRAYLLFVLILIVLLIVVFIILITLIILVLTVLLDVDGSLLLPLHPTFGQLLHHLQELLSVVLQEIIGHRQDVPYFQKFSTSAP